MILINVMTAYKQDLLSLNTLWNASELGSKNIVGMKYDEPMNYAPKNKSDV